MNNVLLKKKIFGKYKIINTIGKGSFGFVYKGQNIKTKEFCAIKVEDISKHHEMLDEEAQVLYILQGKDAIGIPKYITYGIHSRYKILIEGLLWENLGTLFNKCRLSFNFNEICIIGIQLIDRLEYIHSKYFIHRDLKPENLMIDSNEMNIIYLIDFGLCKKYRSSRTGKHIKFSIPRKFTGTARYASVTALLGYEQSRRDDIESLGYILLFFAIKGKLPWINLDIKDKLERYKYILRKKRYTLLTNLCQNAPEEIYLFLKYAKNLKFEQEPDYNYLRGIFKEHLIKCNYNINNLEYNFSWINNNNDNKNKNNPRTKSVPPSPRYTKKKKDFRIHLINDLDERLKRCVSRPSDDKESNVDKENLFSFRNENFELSKNPNEESKIQNPSENKDDKVKFKVVKVNNERNFCVISSKKKHVFSKLEIERLNISPVKLKILKIKENKNRINDKLGKRDESFEDRFDTMIAQHDMDIPYDENIRNPSPEYRFKKMNLLEYKSPIKNLNRPNSNKKKIILNSIFESKNGKDNIRTIKINKSPNKINIIKVNNNHSLKKIYFTKDKKQLILNENILGKNQKSKINLTNVKKNLLQNDNIMNGLGASLIKLNNIIGENNRSNKTIVTSRRINRNIKPRNDNISNIFSDSSDNIYSKMRENYGDTKKNSSNITPNKIIKLTNNRYKITNNNRYFIKPVQTNYQHFINNA